MIVIITYNSYLNIPNKYINNVRHETLCPTISRWPCGTCARSTIWFLGLVRSNDTGATCRCKIRGANIRKRTLPVNTYSKPSTSGDSNDSNVAISMIQNKGTMGPSNSTAGSGPRCCWHHLCAAVSQCASFKELSQAERPGTSGADVTSCCWLVGRCR
jgi:Tfp pilus assembly major pilin PilA